MMYTYNVLFLVLCMTLRNMLWKNMRNSKLHAKIKNHKY